MGYVSNWLNDHNFHRDDRVEPEDTLKTIWETALLIVLVVMVIVTVVALVSPNTAAIIMGYFL
jgi:hypothetical protein